MREPCLVGRAGRGMNVMAKMRRADMNLENLALILVFQVVILDAIELGGIETVAFSL